MLEVLCKLKFIRSAENWLLKRLVMLLHKLKTQVNHRPQLFSILLRNSICICGCVTTVCITSESEVLVQAVRITSAKIKVLCLKCF